MGTKHPWSEPWFLAYICVSVRERDNNKIKIENCNEIFFLYIHTYKVKVYSMLNSIIDDVIFVCRICASISFSEYETL